MKCSFPTSFAAIFLGKSREAGEFTTPEGEVKFGDAFEFAFDSSEGLAQTVRIGDKALYNAGGDFDVRKADRFVAVEIVGDVQVNDRGGYLRPSEVKISKPPARAAA